MAAAGEGSVGRAAAAVPDKFVVKMTGLWRVWRNLIGCIHLDDVAVAIHDIQLKKPCQSRAVYQHLHRVIVWRLFFETQRQKSAKHAFEIVSSKRKMHVIVVEVSSSKGSRQMLGEVQLLEVVTADQPAKRPFERWTRTDILSNLFEIRMIRPQAPF